MGILQAIILGVIQGATEFLPVSSSGHLVLIPWWLGWELPHSLVYPVAVHLGTLLAVLIYFRQDWVHLLQGAARLIRTRKLDDPYSVLFVYIVVGSIPAGILGTAFAATLEKTFQNPVAVSLLLLVTAGLLTLSERVVAANSQKAHDVNGMTWQDALFIGIAQLFALLPGISRSGSTIAAGLIRGLDRPESARFSFLLGAPAIVGAGLLTSIQAVNGHQLDGQLLPLLAGLISAAIVGYAAIAFLLAFVRRRRMYTFAVYCTVVATVSLLAIALGR